jgi:hypothetical protein
MCANPYCPVWIIDPRVTAGRPRRYCCDACKALAYRLRLGRPVRTNVLHHSADCPGADREHFHA